MGAQGVRAWARARSTRRLKPPRLTSRRGNPSKTNGLRPSVQHNPSNTASPNARKRRKSAILAQLEQLAIAPTKNPETFAATPEILAPDRADRRAIEQRRSCARISTGQNMPHGQGDHCRRTGGSAAEPQQNHSRTINPMTLNDKSNWFRSSANSASHIYAHVRTRARTHRAFPKSAEPAEPR